MMNSSEDAIRKVLAGLRGCDVPAGMERRVLKAVQDHASAESRSGWLWSRPVWLVKLGVPIMPRHLLFGVAVTGILAVALAIPLFRRMHRVGGAASQFRKVAPALADTIPPATSSLVGNNAAVLPTASGVRSAGKKRESSARLVRDLDSLALRELHAASRPAPPAPLTQEEKMLLRFIHSVGPQELAILDPEKCAKQEAEANAEFQQFFGQVTAQNNDQN